MKKIAPGKNGEKFIVYDERSGEESSVYFTKDLSAEGLKRIYEKVNDGIEGKVAIKLHTGEQNGPNIIPRPWVKELIESKLPDATIVETNTYYDGDRYTTERHRETLKVNGWTFAPVDILDEEGTIMLPIKNGKWFEAMSSGSHIVNYDSLIALTHFKGHTCGGFGGSNKNLGIGCADGRVGKAMIHTEPGSDDMWGIVKEEFMERMTESTKSVLDLFGEHITFVNVMRNMSVDCDCAGCGAEPVVTPDVGILASKDIVALDQACIDIIFAMNKDDGRAMVERVTTRHGLRQLTYMNELGMGNTKYRLLDIDNEDKPIRLAEIVCDLKPFGEK